MARRSRHLGGFVLRNGIFVPSLIKSIQRNTITLADTVSSNTATLSPGVSLVNSRLVWLGNSSENSGGGGTGFSPCSAILTFTNSTTITASRVDTAGAVIVSFEVIEYWPGIIRSVQRDTVTATASTSGTKTITAVNLKKAILDLLGWSNNEAFTANRIMTRIDLTNSTTVTINKDTATNDFTAGFQVTEWF